MQSPSSASSVQSVSRFHWFYYTLLLVWTGLVIASYFAHSYVPSASRAAGTVINLPFFTSPTSWIWYSGYWIVGVVLFSSAYLYWRKHQEALQVERDFARQIMDTMGQGLVVLGQAGNMQYTNAAFSDMLRYNPEQLVGKHFSEFITALPPNSLSSHSISTIVNTEPSTLPPQNHLNGRDTSYEASVRTSDGEQRPVLVTIVPPPGDHPQTGAILVLTDLTQQKQIETQLLAARDNAMHASRMKSEFLANMSHEIRTPLNAIIGMTSLMLETDLQGEQRDFAETVRTSSDTLLSIIDEILDFSKIEAGKLELEQRPFNIRECVEDTLDLLASKAAAKDLELAYFIDDDVVETIQGDGTRLRQILINLVGNAVKFTNDGEVVISVTSNHQVDSDQELQFAIRDTGIGIPAARTPHLFQAFTQVDSSTTRQFGGTGLGLTISKRLTEMMGGRMWVESEDGAGSTFYFTLHAIIGLLQEESSHAQIDLSCLIGKRLLIVDNNETNRNILVHYARAWGMTPYAFPSGAATLEWLREGLSLDIAILDMHMPEMDGLKLANYIRQIPDAAHLPIILLTSLGLQFDASQQNHVSAHIVKPIKPRHLTKMLVQMLTQDETTVNTSRTSVSHTSTRSVIRMHDRHPLRIIVAEDNLVNQKVAVRMLQRLGYAPDVAINGHEVMGLLSNQEYDVILMDVQMPDMDGLETTKQIRAMGDAVAQPHIIAVTAHALEGDRDRCLQIGMNDYISKPVRTETLISALQKAPTRVQKSSPSKRQDTQV